jgi:hypothetical protein
MLVKVYTVAVTQDVNSVHPDHCNAVQGGVEVKGGVTCLDTPASDCEEMGMLSSLAVVTSPSICTPASCCTPSIFTMFFKKEP